MIMIAQYKIQYSHKQEEMLKAFKSVHSFCAKTETVKLKDGCEELSPTILSHLRSWFLYSCRFLNSDKMYIISSAETVGSGNIAVFINIFF